MRDYFKVWGRLFWRNPWYSVSNMSSKTKTKAIFFWARFILMRPFSALHIHQGFVFLWVGGNESHSSLSIRAHLGRNSAVVHLIETSTMWHFTHSRTQAKYIKLRKVRVGLSDIKSHVSHSHAFYRSWIHPGVCWPWLPTKVPKPLQSMGWGPPGPTSQWS